MKARSIFLAAVAAATVMLATSVSEQGAGLVSQAEARVGRPLTPMSYAGVARRTTRRAVGAAAVGGAAYYGAYPPGCVQVVDAYGRVVTRCP